MSYLLRLPREFTVRFLKAAIPFRIKFNYEKHWIMTFEHRLRHAIGKLCQCWPFTSGPFIV